jgi:hypothetical protein
MNNPQLALNLGEKLQWMHSEDWRGEEERNTLGMAGYWLKKLSNDECLLEMTISMLEQDIAEIREIIIKGGTAEDVLNFLDTPKP